MRCRRESPIVLICEPSVLLSSLGHCSSTTTSATSTVKIINDGGTEICCHYKKKVEKETREMIKKINQF